MRDTLTQQRAMGVLAVVAFAVLLWLALPVAAGLVLGALVAFTLYPRHRRMVRRTHRPLLSALLWTSLSTLGVAGALTALGYLLVVRGAQVVSAIPRALEPGGFLEKALTKAGSLLAPLHVPPDFLSQRLRSAAGDAAPRLAGYAGAFTGAVFDGLVALLFMAMTTYVVLCGWPRLVRCLESIAPLPRRHTRYLLNDLRETSRHVMLGTVVTGIVQGTLAGIGYWFCGVPQPAFFGAMTAVASLLPLFGTLFVWVPIGIYLAASGHTTHALIELAWGAIVVVGLCDYFIRAKLVGSGESMKLFPTLVALFGGLKIFGVFGLVLGPIVLALALDALALYRRERARAGAARVDSRAWSTPEQPSPASPPPSPSRPAPVARTSLRHLGRPSR